MRRPILFIAGGVVLGLFGIWFLAAHYAFHKSEVISCVGYLFLLASAALLYYQIKSTIWLERRKATHQFLYGPIVTILLPHEKELKRLLNRPVLIFEATETVSMIKDDPTFEKIHPVLLEILNFYERMVISLHRYVLDEDMLYDDKGAIFLSFYGWVQPFIKEMQEKYDSRAFANVAAFAGHWRERYDKAEREHKKSQRRFLEARALQKRDPFS